MAGDTTTLGSEPAALEALKAKVNDPACPTLDRGRAFLTHRRAYPQTLKDLANKLGMPQQRPAFSRLESLAELPETSDLEGKILTEWEIRDYLDRRKKSGSSTDLHTPVEEDPLPSVETSTNLHTAKEANKGLHTASTNLHTATPSDSPHRVETSTRLHTPFLVMLGTSIDKLLLSFTWVKEPCLGTLAEQWGLWFQGRRIFQIVRKVTVLGLAAYGLWHAGIDLRNAVPKVRAFFRPSAPAGSAAPGATFSIPTPQIIESSWVYGHRLKLRWNSTGPTHRYRIYWTSRKGDDTRELSPIAVKTPGAIVQASRFLGAGVITVRATDPEDRESSPSKGILFDPEPVNDKDSVEPLPMEGAAGSSVEAGGGVRESGGGKQPLLKKDFPSPASRLPAPAPTLQPPTEVHVDVRTPNSIRLSWRPVAKDVRYNVYSSGSRQLTGLRKENEAPLKSNAVEWIPETGLDRYWIVVTTLASDGRESAYSEAVEVIRYPEKTGRSAGDEAAGVLRKVLPW